jgi:hypothetical protein
MRIVVSDGSEPATPDTGLVRLLVRVNTIREQLQQISPAHGLTGARQL